MVTLNTSASSVYFIKVVNNNPGIGGYYNLSVGQDASVLSISGPTSLCEGSESTFTLQGLTTGSTVVWDKIKVGQLGDACITSSNNSQATFEFWELGIIRVRAPVQTPCGQVIVLSEPVHLGMPYYIEAEIYCEESCGGGAYLCTEPSPTDPHNNVIAYRLNSVPDYPVTLNCTITDANSDIIYQNSKAINSLIGYEYLPRTLPEGFLWVRVWLSGGACNATSEVYASGLQVLSCGYFRRILAYPNPTSSELKISYASEEINSKESGDYKMKQGDFNVKLLDKIGKILKEGHTSVDNKNITLSVADVPNGIFFLHIFEGKNVSKQQIVILH